MEDSTNGLVQVAAHGAFPERAIKAVLLRDCDPERGKQALVAYGHDNDALYKEYLSLISAKEINNKDIPAKKKATFTAKFILKTFQVLKLKETNVFYIGHISDPLFRKCQSIEELSSCVSYWYQMLFGFSDGIQDATKILLSGILPGDHYGEVNRDYIKIMDRWYWCIKTANVVSQTNLPENTRVFAKMFDTEDEDENVFKVPEFDELDFATFITTYNELKDTPYPDWPDKYHLQCFKDWSMDRPDVEFGMFTVIAIPFMRPGMIRGSLFNVGEGHNGKSIVLGVATSLVGSRNTTTVSGNDLGSWDYLVDLQTTWFNCPSETELDFLKEKTGAFKTISAHETYSIRKKHGDASVPIRGNFPMVFNINKIPDFGEDAPAILSRMFINNFDRDFEAEGIAVKNYARKTFLKDKETMPMLTGMVLAFAHYYSQPEHLWKESPSMKAELAALTDIATPERRYVEWFKKFFIGYTGITAIKPDYANFGRQEGEEYDTAKISQKSLLFKQFKSHNLKEGTQYLLDEKPYPVKRFVLSKKMYINKYMGTMNWEEFTNSGESLVYRMMLDYLGKEAEYRGKLKLNNQTKTEEEIQKKVLQDMWLEIDQAQKGGVYER